MTTACKTRKAHKAISFSVLKEQLGKLAIEANIKFPTLNMGGCCVFAAAVAAELDKRHIETTVRVLSYMGTDLDAIRQQVVSNNGSTKSLRDWNDQGLEFYHVLVQFRHSGHNYFYETSHGLSTAKTLPQGFIRLCNGELQIDEAEALANQEGWNTMFDRDQIPAVKKLVKDYFIAIDKLCE